MQLSDEVYKDLIFGVTGTVSCSQCSHEELLLVYEALKKAGFKPQYKKLPVTDENVGRASVEQLSYIKGLWELVAREKTEKALRSFVRHIASVDDLRFLTRKKASNLIVSLRNMAITQGINPDCKDY
ncbi:MAG: regulatory protein GemA [Bacteroidales bacterium]